MFNLNANLLSGATSWDTNYARKYLQISKDQLEKMNKIPGWSKTASGKENSSENVEKQLTQQTSTENISTIIANVSPGDNNNSDLQSKEQSTSEKEIFLKNFSLSLSKKDNTSAYSLKRSSSLPDLHQELQSHSEVEEFSRKRTHSIKDIPSSKLQCLLKRNLLKESSTVPLISDDGVNPDKLFGIDGCKSISCPLKQLNETSKQKQFKALDDSILNHKYLKDIISVIESDADFLSSNGADQPVMKQEISSFEKRLLMLEKRFSPSKEIGPSPFHVKSINVENSNSEDGETFGEIFTVTRRRNSVKNLAGKLQNSSVSASQSLEPKTNSQPLNGKGVASDKDGTSHILKTAVSNFDSFLSPEIPCGQPVSTEVPSQSVLFPSQESVKLTSPRKFQNASPPVPCGQPLPMEVPSATEPIPPQKLAELNTPSKSQNATLLDNKMAEKTCGTFSVFSASSNEKISDLVSSKELGTKRKRKNRGEKSSKKLDAKRMKKIDIQFSSSQIKGMLEIMKLFHTEV